MRTWILGFAFAFAAAGCGGDDPATHPTTPQPGDAADLGATPADLGSAHSPDLGTSTSGCPGAGQSCSTGNP
ncbi:MAG TPA: hypothetical protein VGH63_01535, partial [Polyangia bacterium]